MQPIDQIVKLLSSYRLRFGTEELLQADVAAALEAGGFDAKREYILDGASRIDFYVPKWRIGLECKTDGGPSAIVQQLLRYAKHPDLDGLILVTRRRTHLLQELTLQSKPLRCLWIGGSGL